MAIRILREARDDLRSAVRYYRSVKPPVLGKQLAARLMVAFREALEPIAAMPLGCPEHPEILGARYLLFNGFPYHAFYTVKDGDAVVVAVEYATRDYVDRITKRTAGAT